MLHGLQTRSMMNSKMKIKNPENDYFSCETLLNALNACKFHDEMTFMEVLAKKTKNVTFNNVFHRKNIFKYIYSYLISFKLFIRVHLDPRAETPLSWVPPDNASSRK